jgi:Domain of unknown function (DUF4437)
MRPHVEVIDEKDYIFHIAELAAGEGKAKQKNLSYDEEDGSASLKVHFDSAWSRPGGVHHADTEWFVLAGEVMIGDQKLEQYGYWHSPKGVYTPAISVKEGTVILLYREYGDWGFDVTEKSRDFIKANHELTVTNSNDKDWIRVEDGSPMRFDLGGSPVPGLYIKMLHRDPDTGFYTRLIKAKPGWKEHPLAHHPVFEESYCLHGSFELNFGPMYEGVYSFRPPFIRHGDFAAGEEHGTTWIIRCDGDLVDWYTEEASIEMLGKPVNWGEHLPHTLPPRLPEPVRSRTIGPMKDARYQ